MKLLGNFVLSLFAWGSSDGNCALDYIMAWYRLLLKLLFQPYSMWHILQTKSCHDASFAVIGGTWGDRCDHLRCCQWHQSWLYGKFCVSMQRLHFCGNRELMFTYGWYKTPVYHIFMDYDFSRCQHIEAETKYPPFTRRHFQMHFLEWKSTSFVCNFILLTFVRRALGLVHRGFCATGLLCMLFALCYALLWLGTCIIMYSNIGSNNGSAPIRRQVIIWANNGIDYCRIYASPGLSVKLSWAVYMSCLDLW